MKLAVEWAVAEQRFHEGYGSRPNLRSREDRAAFSFLLVEEIRRTLAAELAEHIQTRTEQFRERVEEALR